MLASLAGGAYAQLASPRTVPDTMEQRMQAMEQHMQQRMQGDMQRQMSEQLMRQQRHMHELAGSMRQMTGQMRATMMQVRELARDPAMHEDGAMQQEMERLREHMQGMVEELDAGVQVMERLQQRTDQPGETPGDSR